MSSEDFSDLGAIPANDDFSDLGAIPAEEEPNSLADTASRKFLQSATAGFSDEFSGGVEALGKALGVEGAGGKLKDIKLSKEGPTLNPEVLLKAYQDARDRERSALKKDEKDNPNVALVSELAGGVLSPVNKIMPGASLLKQGAAIGALTGLGTGEGGLIEQATNTAGGAVLGGALGKGIEIASPYIAKGIEAGGKLVGKALKGPLSLIYDKLPDRIKLYVEKKAQEGVDISTPEFAQEVQQMGAKLQSDLTEEVTGFTGKQQAKLNKLQSEAEELKTTVQQRSKDIELQNKQLDKKYQEVENSIEKQMELDQQLKISKDSDITKNIIKQKNEYALKLQKDFDEIGKNISNQYDQVNKQINKSNYKFDNRQLISDLDPILEKAGAGEIKSLIKSDMSFQEFQELKKKLIDTATDLNRKQEGKLSGIFKQAYGKLNEEYLNGLSQIDVNAANQLRNVNTKQSNFYDLKDLVEGNKIISQAPQVEGQLSQRVVEDTASNPTLRLINKLGKAETDLTGESARLSDEFFKQLGIVSPETAPIIQKDIQSTLQNVKKAEGQLEQKLPSFSKRKQTSPELSDINLNKQYNESELIADKEMIQNELNQLEKQMGQLTEETKDALPLTELKGEKSSVESVLQNRVESFGKDPVKDKQFLNSIKNIKGEEYASTLESKLNEYQKLKTATSEFGSKGFGTKKIGSVIGAGAGSVVAGPAGAVVGSGIGSTTSFFDKIAKGSVDALAAMNPQQTSAMASKLSRNGSVGQEYANQLLSTIDKQGVAKYAVLNTLMQQPAFRKLLNKNKEVEDGSED